jgi:hypothetical protein
VFDGDGRWLGTNALPKNGYPLHIGADILIVRITDEMDVHYIEVYELKKPHATAACLM